MKVRTAKCITLAVLILLAAAFQCRAGESAPSAPAAPDGAKPSLYIIAPTWEASFVANPLPCEAALRAAAVDLAARGVFVVYIPLDQLSSGGPIGYPRLTCEPAAQNDVVTWSVKLYRAADKSTALAAVSFDATTWDDLVRTASAATSEISEKVSKELSLPALPQEGKLSVEQLAGLAGAYAAIIENGPSSVVSSAGTINSALAAAPRSADALRAACWPACLIGSQDLHGYFSLRSRWLAVPLSWWIAAERVAPAASPRDKLTGAWVALLCGFPAKTMDVVSTLDSSSRQEPLAAALEMFATRDWRALTDAAAPSAPYIRQLAWVWALQECGLYVDRESVVRSVVTKREDFAFGPVYGVSDVGVGFTSIMPAFFAARDARELLLSGLLSDNARQDLALASLRTAQLTPAGNQLAKANTISGWLYESLSTDNLEPKAVSVAEAIYSAGLAAPDGPLSAGGASPSWQSLSPWAWSQVERGLFVRALEERLYFLQHMWGVPDAAREYTNRIVSAPGPASQFRVFFEAVQSLESEDFSTATRQFIDLLETAGGQTPVTCEILSEWTEAAWLDGQIFKYKVPWRPLGAWDYQLLLAAGSVAKPGKVSSDWFARCLSLDPWSSLPAKAMPLITKSDADALAEVKRVPWNYALISGYGHWASDAKKYALATDFFKSAVSLAPDNIMGYWWLGWCYVKLDEKQKAIDVLRIGCSTASDSVTTSNCTAWLSELLLETGQKAEALKWASKAAGSYSHRSLAAYARALDANGKKAQAREVFKRCADRYDNAVSTYIEYMLDEGTSAGELAAEATRLADVYKPTHLNDELMAPLLVRGEFDGAQALLNGPFAGDDEYMRSRDWGYYYMMKGDFPQALERYKQAVESPSFVDFTSGDEKYVLEYAFVSALMMRDSAKKVDVSNMIKTYLPQLGRSSQALAYAVGEIKADAAEKALAGKGDLVHLHFIMACQAEEAGKIDEARKLYTSIADAKDNKWMFACAIAKTRLKALEGK